MPFARAWASRQRWLRAVFFVWTILIEGVWERAVGYSVATEKLFCSHGKVIRADIVEHYPPDTTACIFWLKNRQPHWPDADG